MKYLYILKINFILKLFIIITINFIFFSCTNVTNINEKREWQDISTLRDKRDKFEIGDIIIEEKVLTKLGSELGHSAIIVKKDFVGDYTKTNSGYFEEWTYSWLYEDRKAMVLRYKKFDKKFQKVFEKNIKKYATKEYGAISGKDSDTSFYCSKYVWFIFFITAKELGYELDLDSDGGYLVLPYDFIESEDLVQIIF
jgi:uncharacterized protein YycO